MAANYCEACDIFEKNDACLDTETCSLCAGNLTACDDLEYFGTCAHCDTQERFEHLDSNSLCDTCADDLGEKS